MGEPYDARECPVCGSDFTGSYSYSAQFLGYRSECYSCRTVWEFPGDIPADEVMRWVAKRSEPQARPTRNTT
jgi:hypothetical protein